MYYFLTIRYNINIGEYKDVLMIFLSKKDI